MLFRAHAAPRHSKALRPRAVDDVTRVVDVTRDVTRVVDVTRDVTRVVDVTRDVTRVVDVTRARGSRTTRAGHGRAPPSYYGEL